MVSFPLGRPELPAGPLRCSSDLGKHFPGDGKTHVSSGIARIETQAVECLVIIEEDGQLRVDGVEVCFRIWEARGFAHRFHSLLPISNIKKGDLIHLSVSEKQNDFGGKNISIGVSIQ